MNRGWLADIVKAVPEVKQYLSNEARWSFYKPAEYKTSGYMLAQIEGLIRGVYANNLGGEFIDVMANVISGQLTQAYQQAYMDQGFTDYFLPEYLNKSLEQMILNEYQYVDQLFRDIIDARLNGTSIQPLLNRAKLWANKWDAAYNEAIRQMAIVNGQNLMWVLGDAEHCTTCRGLSGLVAWASEWDMIGIHPQSQRLACHGYNCACSLVPTDKRRSPGAYGRIEEALLRG